MSDFAMEMVGPAFEELDHDTMMDIDGEWTPLAWSPVAASSGFCATGAAVTIISYCVVRK